MGRLLDMCDIMLFDFCVWCVVSTFSLAALGVRDNAQFMTLSSVIVWYALLSSTTTYVASYCAVDAVKSTVAMVEINYR